MAELSRRVKRAIRLLFDRGGVERDLDDELRHHLELEAAANESAGLDPQAARRKAELDFGNRQVHREQTRASWRVAWLDDAWRDLRQAARWLRREPGFTVVAVVTLALGLGANAAVFDVVRATLFEPLSYRDPASLVVLSHRTGSGATATGMRIPAPDVGEYRATSAEFSAFAFVANPIDVVLGHEDQFDHARLNPVTANLFDVLGAGPRYGRTFTADEGAVPADQQTDSAVTAPPAPLVLEFGFWQRRFGSDEAIVGRVVQVNGQAMVVVGVMPEGFAVRLPAEAGFPDRIDGWTPLRVDVIAFRRPDRFQDQDSDNTGVVIGRMRDGSNLTRARAELDGIAAQQRSAYPSYARAELRIEASLLPVALVRPVKAAMVAAQVAVAIVLLIICANLASLLAARSLRREREMAVRAALGAGRGRLVRQLLVECALLVGCAAVGGVVAHEVLRTLVLRLAPPVIALRAESLPAFQVVGVMVVLAAVSVVVSAVAPVIVTRRESGGSALAGRTGVRGGGSARFGWRKGLLIGEMALTTVLVVGAGLMLRSLSSLSAVDPGFEVEDRVAFEMALDRGTAGGPAARARMIVDLRARLMQLPGIKGVGFTGALPLSGRVFRQPVGPDGEPPEDWGELQADFRVVNSDYFNAMGIRRLAGRTFTGDEDLFEERRIVIVDAGLASRLAPGGNVVGQYLTVPLEGQPVRAEVVGVVESVRHASLRLPGSPTLYVPYRQEASRLLTGVVFGDVAVPTIERDVRRILAETGRAAEFPVYGFRPLERDVARDMSVTRFIATVTAAFALFSILLAGVGLYGVVAFAAADRRWEFGLRMAMGATPVTVLRGVLVEGIKLALVGVAGGIVLALGLAWSSRELFVGVSPLDPGVLVLSSLLFGAVALLATVTPAWRASRIDPAESLRAP